MSDFGSSPPAAEGGPDARSPRVSVLMPTFRHGWVIGRALESLLAQDYQDWELILVNDGSPDDTESAVAAYLADTRIRYYRFERNRGLGAVLNYATDQARGEFVAYLPSDDIYHPDHLSSLLAVLDSDEQCFLAYSGVRSHKHWWGWGGLTLQGELDFEVQGRHVVGNERKALAGELPHGNAMALSNDNILALVQVMHRRSGRPPARWTEREQFVSDSLEPDFWRALLDAGLRFACTGSISCEWTDHPEQRHKIIAEAYVRPPPLEWPTAGRGLSAYRRYYGIAQGVALNWRPTLGPKTDERQWYADLPAAAPPAGATGLKIHIVGDLGFNPDRLIALEDAGHQLSATWASITETWDSASSLPFGDLIDIPWGPQWREQISDVAPDVIYALLNVHALPLIHAVLQTGIDIPLVFHFKESPQRTMMFGLWRQLGQVLRQSSGLIFISQENLDWYRANFADLVRHDRVLVLDGDLPHAHWMRGQEWTTRLSEQDDTPHIVCVGRPLSLQRLAATARSGVHVHCYGSNFHPPEVVDLANETARLHLHPTVEPVDWVTELSRYDAAWVHDVASDNRGDIRKACWGDLNLPARLGTYAAAGLPWLVRGNEDTVTAVRSLAEELGGSLGYDTIEQLGAVLRDRGGLDKATQSMRANRLELSFNRHVDRLTAFFRAVAS